MTIYPAIDILDGKCVRLSQGKYDKSTIYSDKPYIMAQKWEKAGARYLHLVDLDGAKAGRPVNTAVIGEILKKVSIPVQLGGGIRKPEDIELYISMGISRVVLGTSAVENHEFVRLALQKHGEKIAVGIDAKDGMAATGGWETVSNFPAVDLAKKMCDLGVKTIIYTDIATDGMLSGPNVKAMKEMADSISSRVIASGGVSSLEDVKRLIPTGVSGVIIGRALYTGNLKLEDCLCLQKE
jgi:phosphoribosylformimino-5-aminoimidazole carboxamide ribotide isomerase